jgi:flagellar hook-length control protein FliK
VPSPGQHQNANSAGVLRGGEANSLSDTGPQLRFAQHLAAKPGARVGKTSPLTDLEHVRLVDRVARAFQTAEARGGTVTLRRHPPELGALRVELRVTDGVLSARLEAETPAARTILLENVQVLHDRLAEQGMRIERFDVDLLDHRPPGDSSGFEQPRSRDQESRQQSHSNGNQPDSHEAESPRMGTRGGSTGNLNIIV